MECTYITCVLVLYFIALCSVFVYEVHEVDDEVNGRQ